MSATPSPPLAISTPIASMLLGISRPTLARHAARGLKHGDELIIPVRAGHAWSWPTASILDALKVPSDPGVRADLVRFAEAQVRAQYKRENEARGAAA